MGGTGDAGVVLFDGFLDGSFDCVDRVVLRAYFQLGQRAPGLRMWWRRWQGSDEGLNNTRLMRVAGRFARRVKGWAKSAGVPVVYSKTGDRNEDLAGATSPKDRASRACSRSSYAGRRAMSGTSSTRYQARPRRFRSWNGWNVTGHIPRRKRVISADHGRLLTSEGW